MVEARFNGREYRIPEYWLMGYCSTGLDGTQRSLMDAVAWWAWQQELAERGGSRIKVTGGSDARTTDE